MPDVASVHVNQALTDLVIGFPQQSFAAPRILLDYPVAKESDTYYIFDSSKRLYAQVDDNRAPGAEANMVDFETTTDTYRCQGHALSAAVPDEEAANADPVYRPMMEKTDFLTGRLLLNMEINLKAAMDTAVTQGSGVLTNEWTDPTDGTPISDINAGISAIEDATGLKPNIMVMDSKVWRALSNHPEVVERCLYGGTNGSPAQVLLDAFAAFFGFDEIIVPNTLKNTAMEGQTAAVSRVWGEDAYILYRPTNPGLKIPAFGYRFTWRPFTGSRQGWQVSSWREDKRKSNMVQVERWFDQKITLAASGYRIQGTLT